MIVRVKEEKEKFEKAGKRAEFVYLSTDVVYQLQEELGADAESISELEGMVIKFVPGIGISNLIAVSDFHIC